MSIYEDHRKRICFSHLSNSLEFTKVETMQYGDKMQFGFRLGEDTFMATFTDKVWRIAAIKATDAYKPKYEKHYPIEDGREILLLLSDLVPVGAYGILEDALSVNVLETVYFPVLSFILAGMNVRLDRKNIIMTPKESIEKCGKSIVVVRNPSTGFMYITLHIESDSLVLSYKLSKTGKKKNADGYSDIINTAAYGFVDLVTDSDVDDILKELKMN